MSGVCCEEYFVHGKGCPLFDIIYPAFLLTATTSTSLQRALKNNIAQSEVPGNVYKPSGFSLFDGRQ
ncbi:hypothetical protein DPMN_083524 [Dreissena polymorpha]|uniref:Uncharacterized protein n=1 Tax=Dreissena polymorpha TaxID=45954 RepID=A0A9D3YBE2_DREPO|nr:hypothetical protein DPMN_083524 [Dreissena polymorpha]